MSAHSPLPQPLDMQIETLKRKYPGTDLGATDQDGRRLLIVPGVQLPKGWHQKEITIFVIIPKGFPMAQPERFYTTKDVRLEHGGCPQNTADAHYYGGELVRGLLWWHWRICHPDKAISLVQYVAAMRRRFSELH